MEDSYLQAEALGGETIEYVKVQNATFREKFGEKSREIRDEVAGYYSSKRILSVKVTEKGIMQSYLKGSTYSLDLNGKTLYSTDKIIFWFDADDSGERYAVFETGGSDTGTLTVFNGGETIERTDGTFEGILFTPRSYYLVKTFAEEKPVDGGEPNSHRVILDGKIVFGTGLGPEDFITISGSMGQAFIEVGNWSKTRVYRGPIDEPEHWKLEREAEFPIAALGVRDGKSWYLDQKSNGRLLCDGEVIVEPEKTVESALLLDQGILAIHLEDARAVPVLYDFDGNRLERFDFQVPMGVNSLDSMGETAVLSAESFGIRSSLYRLDGNELTEVEEIRLIDVSVEDRWADSSGTGVHYFEVKKKGDSPAGAIVYGYGGFNIPVEPRFFPLFAYLLNHGVAVVVCNLRGGSEYGEEWHLSGIREKKQNVFDDFRAIVSDIRKEGLRVVTYGVSNGGLLAGVSLTQFPELLCGVVIGNPVLDMMRYHRLSVGRYWVPEFGDPDNPTDRGFLLKYSPYHNLSHTDYPDTLIYSRLKDDRVHPAHAIKFHMRMSENSGNSYLRINTEGGHIGITADQMVEEISDIGSFVMSCLS